MSELGLHLSMRRVLLVNHLLDMGLLVLRVGKLLLLGKLMLLMVLARTAHTARRYCSTSASSGSPVSLATAFPLAAAR